MKLYKEVKRRHVTLTITRLDTNRLSEIVSEWVANCEKRRQEEKQRARLELLKEQARHFEPFVPKLTSAYHIKKQSSVSVLQSFTSAVQQLCSPEKKNGSSSRKSENTKPPQCIDLCTSSDDEVENLHLSSKLQ